MTTNPGEGISLLRLPAVKARTGLSRSAIYRKVAEGTFARPIHIAGTRVALWSSVDIDAFVAAALETREAA